MRKQMALERAQAAAIGAGVPLVVVNEGPHADEHSPLPSFGYCPERAKNLIYPHATVVATVSSDGVIEKIRRRKSGPAQQGRNERQT